MNNYYVRLILFMSDNWGASEQIADVRLVPALLQFILLRPWA